jgi:AAA domain, putative AbiEii toxin, Type IV TA system
MIERLAFKNLGPSPDMALEFGERLNLLTGDNGLGKTFVLDAAWWALTRTWAEGRMLLPDPQAEGEPEIDYDVRGVMGKSTPAKCAFDFEHYEWKVPQRRPPIPGLVVYARIDGGFSIWDPARNYWRNGEDDAPAEGQRPPAYEFNREQIWTGLWRTPKDEYEKNRDALLCRGLIDDLVSWQIDPAETETARLFAEVLLELSPHANEPLRLGASAELWGRAGKVPTLVVPYAERPVPLEQASAGVKRAIALAYALVWAWVSHRKALRMTKRKVTEAHQIVLLFDEMEAHLHPQWQRRILPALLRAVKSRLLAGADVPVQVIGTTHAPLVLASVETEFDKETDRLFNFELNDNGRVTVDEVPWAKHGDVVSWLESEAFDMESGYSVEAEAAMKSASDFMAGTGPQDAATRTAIEARLRKALGGDDPFLVEWFANTRPEVLRNAAQARTGRRE